MIEQYTCSVWLDWFTDNGVGLYTNKVLGTVHAF